VVATALPIALVAVPSVLGALAAAWTAVSARRFGGSSAANADIARPLAAVCLLTAAGAVAYPFLVTRLAADRLYLVPLVLVWVIFVPWTTLALRYVGRDYLVTRRRMLVGLVAVAAVLAFAVADTYGLVERGEFEWLGLLVSVVSLTISGTLFVATGLVILSAYRHATLSVTHGVVVSMPFLELLFTTQVAGLSIHYRPFLVSLSFLVVGGTLVLGVRRYDIMETRPGTSRLGERTVVESLNEPVLVVDRQGTVIRANERAVTLFGVDEGGTLESVVGRDVTALDEGGDIERWTATGYREFDPRVAAVTDADGTVLGHSVTLIDVTRRELRRQRIQVLNRILRHNVRNSLSAVEARADLALVDDQPVDEHVETIIDVTEDLTELSTEARRIEKLIRDASAHREPVELAALVDSVVEATVDGDPSVDCSVEVPALTLRVNPTLLRYALGEVIENAVEHNPADRPRITVQGSSTPESVDIEVADDGPGIPEMERRVVESGSEQPQEHASSLGLWATNWAVRSLGGRLSLGESDLGGAAVRLELPRVDSETPPSEGQDGP